MWQHTCQLAEHSKTPPQAQINPSFEQRLEFEGGKSLGEYICSHLSCWIIHDLQSPVFDLLANEMKADINVFGAGMELTKFCVRQRDGRLVIIVNDALHSEPV